MTPTKWEYKWLGGPSTLATQAMDQFVTSLDALGADGWEVCATLGGAGDTRILLLKRPRI